MASLESQTIRKVCEIVCICELQQDTPGLGSGGVEQHRKQEVPSHLGMIPGIRGVDSFVNLIVLPSDEGVGAPDKSPKETGALSRVLDLERDGAPVAAKECGECLDCPAG